MFNFIGVFHESSVRASSLIWRVIMSFLKLLVTSILSPPNEKFYQFKAPYKAMSSFQLGKDNSRGRNASVLEDWYCQSVQ